MNINIYNILETMPMVILIVKNIFKKSRFDVFIFAYLICHFIEEDITCINSFISQQVSSDTAIVS